MAKRGNNSLGRRTYGGKPYDANNSFVKKMATKVTDLIPQKSWISKWFNTSQDNGEVSNEDDRSPDTEEETQQPPAKRPRIRMDVTHPPGTFSIKTRDEEYTQNHDTTVSDQTEEYFLEPAVAGPSGVCKLVSSTPAVYTDMRNSGSPRARPQVSQVPMANNGATNGADDNSESGESTSCCSSLIPQTNRQEGAPNSSYGSNSAGSRNRFIDDKSSFTNHLQSPRCLFLGSGGSRDSLSSRRPSFNPSMMSSNSSNNLDRTSSLSSPFYSGNVTFGGGNAVGTYKRGRTLFNNTNEFQLKVPRRTSVQVKPSSAESIDASGMSQTAKRILEAMEYFSSPISDAKKIPVKKMAEQSGGTKRSRDEFSSSSVPATRVGLRHLTRELAVPTVPEMLKLRRRQKLQDTTVAARKIISAMSGPAPSSSWPTTISTTTLSTSAATATINEDYRLRTELDQTPKYHGKLRAKSKNNPEFEGPAPSVNLPSISLEIASLPSFEPLPKYTTPTLASSRKDDEEKNVRSCGYKFASPIKITEASWNLKSINNFSFSKPINANETSPTRSNSVSTTFNKDYKTSKACNDVVPMNFVWSGSSTAPRLKVKAKKETATVANEKCTIFDDSTVKEMAKLSEGTSPLRSNSNDRTSKTESIWECAECYIKNDPRENSCVACKTPKPRATATNDTSIRSNAMANDSSSTAGLPPPAKSIADKAFGAQFKMSTNQWECESCLVRNQTTSLKCVSCSSSKPTGAANKSANSNVTKTSAKFDLAEKFKPAEGSWECSGCMLRNPSSVITCPCCSASKPSLTKTSTKQTNLDVANGAEANKKSAARETSKETLMDKFKPAASTWECPSCLVRNAETASSCVCCSNPKPGGATSSEKETPTRVIESGWGDKFKKPEGTWSCDSCMLQNKSEASACVACNDTKPGSAAPKAQPATSTFSFGIPPNQQNFKFGIDKAEVKYAWSSDEQVTKSIDFCGNTQRTNVDSGTFKFGIPKETDKLETVAKASTNTTGGFVFAAPKTTTASSPTSEMSKSGNDGKSNSMPFIFGMPKSVNKQPESHVAEEDKKKETPEVVAKSDKPMFVFGVPKTSNENSSTENKLIFGAPTSEKVSIFGNQCQATTSNETNASAAPKSSIVTSKTQQSEKPVSSTIPNTNISVPARTPFTFSEPKSKVTAQASQITPSFGQSSVLGSTSAFSSSATVAGQETNSSENKTVTPSFGIPSTASPSTGFGIVANSGASSTVLADASDATKTRFAPAEAAKPTFFGMTGDKNSTTFGAAVEKKTPLFGNPENKLPSVFGTNEKPTITSNTMFNTVASSPSSSSSATAAPPAAFGGTTSGGTTQPVFGNTSTSVFGNNTAPPSFGSGATSNVFAPAGKSTVATAPASNTGLFSFGGANPQQMASQSTPGTFSFTTDNADSAPSAAKPIFGFGNASAAAQPNASECFGATGTNTGAFGTAPTNVTNPTPSPFTFNAPNTKQDPPAFGQATPTIPSMFGTPQSATSAIGQQPPAAPNFAANAAPVSSGFNFRPTAPATGGFNFTGGMAQAPAPPASGFNFNAPAPTPNIAFDPNSRPIFNFTGGTAPTAFNATPQPVPTRKIKKAVRRMQQR